MGNNSHKPAIRFQGFTDAWEQRKLGDIADTKTGPFGTQLSAKEYTASGIPVINVKNIGTGCIQENDLDYVSESTAKRLSDHIIQENDIVFGRKGAIGRHAIIGKTQNNWVQGSDCIRVRFKPGIVASYVNAQLQTANVIDHLSMNAYGSTMLTLTTDMINSIPLLMPEEAEQSEIAHVFSDIDNLITLHQRKYEKLITVKKSMLEKMFPRDGSNYPEIRFIGFTDPWEQRKLSDVFEFLQNNTLSRAELNSERGAAKNIHYGDVLIKFGEYLDVSDAELPFIQDQNIVNKFKGSLLQDGDVIMSDTAEDVTVGKCTEIDGLQGFPTISGLHTIPLRPKNEFGTGFLGYYMNSGSYHDQLLPLILGDTLCVSEDGLNRRRDLSVFFPGLLLRIAILQMILFKKRIPVHLRCIQVRVIEFRVLILDRPKQGLQSRIALVRDIHYALPALESAHQDIIRRLFLITKCIIVQTIDAHDQISPSAQPFPAAVTL